MQGICVLFCSKLLCCFLGSYGGLVFSKVFVYLGWLWMEDL